jgi:hypothetical protein
MYKNIAIKNAHLRLITFVENISARFIKLLFSEMKGIKILSDI